METERMTLDGLLQEAAGWICMRCLHRFDDHAMRTWCQLVSCTCSAFVGPHVREVLLDDTDGASSGGEIEQSATTRSAPPAAQPRPGAFAVEPPQELQ